MNMCEVTDRCMATPWYRVRARYGRHPTVTLVIDTCRRHLSMAVQQGLSQSKGTVSVTEVKRG